LPCSTHTICLLDDEPCVLKALGRLLSSVELSAEKFTEPAAFLAYAKDHPVRLAVIDVRMPGMSGLEVLVELRAASPQAQVIIMTAEDDPAHRLAAMAGGAAAFFLKPFHDEAFLAAVHAAIAPTA
jgi:FixJ family two-component response regulator